MPIFEFDCPDCGRAFEKICLSPKGEKEEVVRCPYCDSDRPKRIFSTFGFKGGYSCSSSNVSCSSCTSKVT